MNTRRASRKYGPAAKKTIRRVMEEWKDGVLRSGRSEKKVTSQKQAIAIGISEARHEGEKVPVPKRASRRRTKRPVTRRSRTER